VQQRDLALLLGRARHGQREVLAQQVAVRKPGQLVALHGANGRRHRSCNNAATTRQRHGPMLRLDMQQATGDHHVLT
jgi:hypothetical protein